MHFVSSKSIFNKNYFLFLLLIVSACKPTSDNKQKNDLSKVEQDAVLQTNGSSSKPILKPGHIVMMVSDLDRSQRFYEERIKLRTVEEVVYEGEKRIFMSASESHHELVLLASRNEEFLPNELRQLQQVAFQVNSHEELINFYEDIKQSEIPLVIKDNQVSLSLYFPDPDSVTIELYWDIQDEPFGEQMWEGRQEDISEEAFREPWEHLQ